MKKLGVCLLLCVLLFGAVPACGPVVQLIDVDVKLPAEFPVSFEDEKIAVFNALYDTVGRAGSVYKKYNDSLLINSLAEGFRAQLEETLSLPPESIPVYNHFCGHTAAGTLEDKEYIYSLAEQTGAGTLILIDSLWLDTPQEMTQMRPVASEYQQTNIYLHFEVVLRIFDMEKDRFTAYLPISDTAYWSVLIKGDNRDLIYNKVLSSLPQSCKLIGGNLANLLVPQWETQERVLFLYGGSEWVKAMDHAFMFEWDKAEAIWLELTKKTKNPQKLAHASYNIAVASEMLGQIDLAKEWLNISRKYFNIPEINHYTKLLEERKQERSLLLQIRED